MTKFLYLLASVGLFGVTLIFIDLVNAFERSLGVFCYPAVFFGALAVICAAWSGYLLTRVCK